MRKYVAASLLLALSAALPLVEAGKSKGKDPKEALQALQEFIGAWKGSGVSDRNRNDFWNEKANWSWRFKGKDVCLSVDLPGSKHFKMGEVRYLPAKGEYELTMIDKQSKKQVFTGTLDRRNILVVDRKNPDTNDTEQIKMNIAGGGDRLVYAFYVKHDGRTMFNRQFQVAYTKEGVTFGVAAGKKGPECVVTGGLGTMQVSYMGVTYYVCCGGCRDAFNENPTKIIAEYKARKRAGN